MPNFEQTYTYTFTCATCGRSVFNQDNRCSICYPVQTIDIAITEELARGYCGAERAEATMQRALIEITKLKMENRNLNNDLLKEEMKNSEILGKLQAYEILDAAGRVNRE